MVLRHSVERYLKADIIHQWLLLKRKLRAVLVSNRAANLVRAGQFLASTVRQEAGSM